MKFEDMIGSKSDAELGSMMRDRFRRLIEARDAGLTDKHPVEQWNADNRVLRAHRAAQDTGLDPGDQPSTAPVGGEAQDDPNEALREGVTHGVTGGPRGGAALSTAQDRAIAARIRNIEATAALIPGYRRLP